VYKGPHSDPARAAKAAFAHPPQRGGPLRIERTPRVPRRFGLEQPGRRARFPRLPGASRGGPHPHPGSSGQEVVPGERRPAGGHRGDHRELRHQRLGGRGHRRGHHRRLLPHRPRPRAPHGGRDLQPFRGGHRRAPRLEDPPAGDAPGRRPAPDLPGHLQAGPGPPPELCLRRLRRRPRGRHRRRTLHQGERTGRRPRRARDPGHPSRPARAGRDPRRGV
ncbi:MAG: Ribonuclease III, partial [uncultured Rubrobacteraceae bacterium]